jgi:hypothetical protein
MYLDIQCPGIPRWIGVTEDLSVALVLLQHCSVVGLPQYPLILHLDSTPNPA